MIELPKDYATEIAPGLYVGHARWLEGFDFDSVLTLSSTMPPAPIHMREKRYGWAGPALPAQDSLHSITAFVDLHWSLLGQATLIRDLTGLNRSCLIAGLALLHHGVSHADALEALQKRSPLALSNGRYRAHFEASHVRNLT